MPAILYIFMNLTSYVLQGWRSIHSFQWHVRHYMNQPFPNSLNERGCAQNWRPRSSVPNRFGYQVLGDVRAMVHASKLNIRELCRGILIIVRLIIHAAVFRMLARSMDTRIRCIQVDGGHCEQHVLAVKYVVITVLNTLRTGLLNCLNARSRGLIFRHRASCI